MKIGIKEAINTMVEAMLPRGTRGRILHVVVDASFTAYLPKAYMDDRCKQLASDLEKMDEYAAEAWYDNERTIDVREYLHFFFYRPSNYTLVLFAKDKAYLDESIHVLRTSYHDSCWRSDGYSEMGDWERAAHDHINMQYKHTIGTEPSEIMEHVSFHDVELLNVDEDSMRVNQNWRFTLTRKDKVWFLSLDDRDLQIPDTPIPQMPVRCNMCGEPFSGSESGMCETCEKEDY